MTPASEALPGPSGSGTVSGQGGAEMRDRSVTLEDIRNTLRSRDRQYNEYRRRVEAVVENGETVVIPDDLIEYGQEMDKVVEKDYARLLAR